MKIRIAMLAVAALIATVSPGYAGFLSGAAYNTGAGFGSDPSSVAGAVALITGTPTATFVSTLVNNGSYNGGAHDGSDLATFLGSPDAHTLSHDPAPMAGVVLDLTGTLTVSVTGTYTFSDNNDDGGGFFLGGTPHSPGTGTELAENDGTHGPVMQSSTISLTAGTPYTLEYVYYNNYCCGYDGTHDNKGGGLQAVATITGPGTVNVVPEPASLALLAVGAIGLFFAARRRRSA